MNSLTIHNRKNHVENNRRKTGEKMNEELELYKLLCTKDNKLNRVAATEIRWEKEECLCWISYVFIYDFVNEVQKIVGRDPFDDGGIKANLLFGDICFDLCEAFGDYIDIEELFPREEGEVVWDE